MNLNIRFKIITILILQALLLSACSTKENVTTKDRWGSFTAEDTYSFDKKYLAEQTVEFDEATNTRYVQIGVKDTSTDKEVYHFTPARARDFWGICWESDTYNIWTQSGDVGVICYRYEDEKWVRDETATRPDDIISKYDEMIGD